MPWSTVIDNENIKVSTKGQTAREQIARALSDNIPLGIVLADAGYGTEADCRDGLQTQKLDYMLSVEIPRVPGGENINRQRSRKWPAERRRRSLIRRDAGISQSHYYM